MYPEDFSFLLDSESDYLLRKELLFLSRKCSEKGVWRLGLGCHFVIGVQSKLKLLTKEILVEKLEMHVRILLYHRTSTFQQLHLLCLNLDDVLRYFF